MKISKITGILILLLGWANGFAQQDPNHTFYRYNMNLYNPAYVGSSGGVDLTLGLRSQWAGVAGAPESQSAIFGMPLRGKIGLGVSILNDQTFIETQTWVALDFSFHIKLNRTSHLYFGLKAGANSYNVNTQGLTTYSIGQDIALTGFKGRLTPNVGAGIYLKHEKYFVSLSAPKLLAPDRLQEVDGDAFLGTDRIHTYLVGGYDFSLGRRTKLKAMGTVRHVVASPLSIEVTGILDLGSYFNFGAGYRFNEGISGLLIFDIDDTFNVGYAYETALDGRINRTNSGTHELFMRFRM